MTLLVCIMVRKTPINFEVSRSNEPTQPTIPSPAIYFFMQIAMINIHALPIIS
jgi:hypothetical protein